MAEQSLYERLGGMFAIAAVVDHFSDQLLKNPKVVNANPELKEWHTETYPGRLPGLKFWQDTLGLRCGGRTISIHSRTPARRPFRIPHRTRSVRRGLCRAWPQP